MGSLRIFEVVQIHHPSQPHSSFLCPTENHNSKVWFSQTVLCTVLGFIDSALGPMSSLWKHLKFYVFILVENLKNNININHYWISTCYMVSAHVCTENIFFRKWGTGVMSISVCCTNVGFIVPLGEVVGVTVWCVLQSRGTRAQKKQSSRRSSRIHFVNSIVWTLSLFTSIINSILNIETLMRTFCFFLWN